MGWCWTSLSRLDNGQDTGMFASSSIGETSWPFFFFFNDTATTEIYTLSLHDALPISANWSGLNGSFRRAPAKRVIPRHRSEEHTSELQSQSNLVCRLLLEKKKIARCVYRPLQPEFVGRR